MADSSKDDLCPVCHEETTYFAVGNCEHAICYRCSTRMRVLCAQLYCAICRADLPKIYFSSSPKVCHQKASPYRINHKHGIYFESEEVHRDFTKLLEHSCNWCEKKPFRTFQVLKDHVRKEHGLHYCDLCVNHLKLFSSERQAYDRKRLAEHRRQGDADDKSHKGHPLCRFCDERYLDNDELVKHLRKDHFYCHFCESDGICNEFFGEYPVLRDHFMDSHFLCEEDDCINVQFTNAFRTEIDLKAHKAQFHMRSMRRAHLKQARVLDIDFSVGSRSASGGGGRGRARGRPHRDTAEQAPGVIGREDYEEVQLAESRRKGSTFNQRRAERQEIETAQAISASLNEIQSKGHVNVIDHGMMETTSGSVKAGQHKEQPQTYQGTVADFPSLNGDVIDGTDTGSAKHAVTQPSAPTKKTLAKSFALANNFSVQEGGLGDEDFPSLGGESTKTNPSSFKKSKNQSKVWQKSDEDFPSLTKSSVRQTSAATSSSKPGRWVTPSTTKDSNQRPAPKPSYKNNPADFPSLSSIGNNVFSLNKSSTIGASSHDSVSKNETKRTKPKAALYEDMVLDEPTSRSQEPAKIQMVTSKYENNNSTKSVPAKPVSLKEEDFPSLAPSNPVSASRNSKKSKAKGQKAGAADSPVQDYKAADPRTQPDPDTGFVKPKKTSKAVSKSLTTNDESKAKVKNSKKKKSKAKKGEEKSDEENEQPFNFFKNDLQKPESESSKPLEERNSPNLSNETSLSSFKVDQVSDTDIKSSAIGNKVDVTLEDFPELLSSLSVQTSQPPQRPPPGFSQVGSVNSKAQPPPGFNIMLPSKSGASTNPPPGFNTSANNQPVVSANQAGHEGKPETSDYLPPVNFSERNQKLISDIKLLLLEDKAKFDDFCLCSKEFRQGTITAVVYYSKCRTLLGEKEFPHIFAELLVLLPDVEKQAELLHAHNKAHKDSKHWSKNKKKWNFPDMTFSVCNTCSQILHSAGDFNVHMQTHCLDTEFPALGAMH